MSGSPSARRWFGLAIMLTGTFMAVMDVFIVNVAIPTIRKDLGASFAEIEFVVAGYGLAYAIALITGGRLGDLHGRRRMFVVGLGGFTVASALCGIAPNTTALICARLLQGVAAAILFPQVFSLIHVSFPEERSRATAFSIFGAVLGLSSIAGQLLGGLLVTANVMNLGWRPVFLVNVPLGMFAMVAAPYLIDESRSPTAHQLDIPGVLVCATGLSLLLFPLIEGRELGWPIWSLVMLIVSVPILGVFGWQQRRRSDQNASPLIETGLFRHKSFAVGITLVFVFYSTLNSFFFVLALMLQLGLGKDALQAGLTYTPLAVAFLLASIVAGRSAPRSVRFVLLCGGCLAMIGSVAAGLIAWWAKPLESQYIIPALIVLGLGQGLFMTPLLNAVLADVPENDVGSASGIVSTMQQIGGAIGVAIVGMIFFDVLDHAHAAGAPSADAYAKAFLASTGYCIAVTVITIALLFMLPSVRSRPSE